MRSPLIFRVYCFLYCYCFIAFLCKAVEQQPQQWLYFEFHNDKTCSSPIVNNYVQGVRVDECQSDMRFLQDWNTSLSDNVTRSFIVRIDHQGSTSESVSSSTSIRIERYVNSSDCSLVNVTDTSHDSNGEGAERDNSVWLVDHCYSSNIQSGAFRLTQEEHSSVILRLLNTEGNITTSPSPSPTLPTTTLGLVLQVTVSLTLTHVMNASAANDNFVKARIEEFVCTVLYVEVSQCYCEENCLVAIPHSHNHSYNSLVASPHGLRHGLPSSSVMEQVHVNPLLKAHTIHDWFHLNATVNVTLNAIEYGLLDNNVTAMFSMIEATWLHAINESVAYTTLYNDLILQRPDLFASDCEVLCHEIALLASREGKNLFVGAPSLSPTKDPHAPSIADQDASFHKIEMSVPEIIGMSFSLFVLVFCQVWTAYYFCCQRRSVDTNDELNQWKEYSQSQRLSPSLSLLWVSEDDDDGGSPMYCCCVGYCFHHSYRSTSYSASYVVPDG